MKKVRPLDKKYRSLNASLIPLPLEETLKRFPQHVLIARMEYHKLNLDNDLADPELIKRIIKLYEDALASA